MRNSLFVLFIVTLCIAGDKYLSEYDKKIVINGDINIVKKRLQSDPNIVKATDKNNVTLLQLAAFTGNLDLIKLFLQNGADVNAMAVDKSTALHGAAREGYMNVSKLLIKNGAKINCIDIRGFAPIHDAVISGNGSLVKYLIDNGADFNRKDNQGATPFDLSIIYKKIDVLLVLREYNAQANKTKGNIKNITSSPLDNSESLGYKILKKDGGNYSIELQYEGGIPEFKKFKDLTSYLQDKTGNNFIRVHFYFPEMNKNSGAFITAERHNGNFYLKYVVPSRLPNSYKKYIDSWIKRHMRNKKVKKIYVSNGPFKPSSEGYRIEE